MAESVREVVLEGPVGALEAMVEDPTAGLVRALGIVCHPHPLHGGSMHNKVVHSLCRALQAVGCITIRFNFRGVGASEGVFADGVGELDDALAVARWARAQWPGYPLGLAGFSFGAAVALGVAVRETLFGLVTVAPPVGRLPAAALDNPGCPWLIVQGDADELVDCSQVLDWVNQLEPGPEVAILSGADHFFHGRLIDLRNIVTDFLGGVTPFLDASR